MDTLDYKAITLLMAQGRMTWAEMGQLLGLSAPAVADRVRKLEERGVIMGYAALVNAEALGFPLVAFVAVGLADQRKRLTFLKGIRKMSQIVECHHVTGDDDYLLKIRCRGTRDLDRILVEELKGKLGVLRTRTTVVLDTAKETVWVPAAPPDAPVPAIRAAIPD
jgi:Lrp/AsnC family leucine-responsive transcriptional regulator